MDVGSLDLDDVRLGDSIANSGVCLTVIAREAIPSSSTSPAGPSIAPSVSMPWRSELSKASGWPTAWAYQLPVVDSLGEVLRFAPGRRATELVIRAPAALAGYIATGDRSRWMVSA